MRKKMIAIAMVGLLLIVGLSVCASVSARRATWRLTIIGRRRATWRLTIIGRVTEKPGPSQLTAMPIPLKRARIAITQIVPSDHIDPGTSITYTNRNGHYRARIFRTGYYKVTASAPGYKTQSKIVLVSPIGRVPVCNFELQKIIPLPLIRYIPPIWRIPPSIHP